MSGKMLKNNLLISTSVFGLLMVPLSLGIVQAEIKDSDLDGLSDESEISVYKTDPNNFDTDGDGYSDGIEVINSTNPLENGDSPPLNIESKKIGYIEAGDPVIWYVSRVTGILAFILLSLVVSFGLVMSSKSLLKFRLLSSPAALETHRTIAWGGILMVLTHFSSFFFDDYIQLDVSEAFIPFLLKRTMISPRGFNLSFPIALGIIAMYLIVVLVVSSELRKKIVNLKVWRAIHYSSFLGYCLFLIHGFTAGSDSKEPWMVAIYVVSLALVLTLLIGRIFSKKLFYPKPKKVETVVNA